jgi:hypothetical protein
MSSPSKRDRQAHFYQVFAKAEAAGRVAADACTPRPMVVGEAKHILSNQIDYTRPTHIIEGGVCGFAWVIVRPGNSPFANWLKATERGTKDSYYGGVNIWIGDYGQSMERKLAHAAAMAASLNGSGFVAQSMSRMD